jgi:hypothetical protein
MKASWIPPALLVAAGAAGLAITNPPPEEFARYAGDQLVELIGKEICTENSLPLTLRLVLNDCPALVASQRQVLGQIALQNSSRLNLGLISVYRTGLGGQRLLPQLQLPRYEAITVAAAGQFALVHRGQSPSPSP